MRVALLLLFILPSIYVYSQNAINIDKDKLKISGYLQYQFQLAQKNGIYSWQGGDFDQNSSSRFMVRRARLKASKSFKTVSLVAQIDAKPEQIQLIDAYIQMGLNKNNDISLTAGVFDKAFGHAVSYSSSERFFPERPMVFQNLFPKEKDLGAKFSVHPKSNLSFLKADLALVNGSGLANKDYDSNKDFIGNVHFQFPNILKDLVDLSFGSSIYLGAVNNATGTYYKNNGSGFNKITDLSNMNKSLERTYFGADIQLNIKSKIGKTTLMSELIRGKQPGVATSASLSFTNSSKSFTSQPKTDLYHRSFSGYYFWLTQEVGQTGLNLLLSYNVFDPNTSINGNQIGLLGNNTSAADLKFSNWGYGLALDIFKNVRATLYYDNVINENSNLSAYQKDIKDDVFTARLQYKW